MKEKTNPPGYVEQIVFPSVPAGNPISGRVARIEDIVAKFAEGLQEYVLGEIVQVAAIRSLLA